MKDYFFIFSLLLIYFIQSAFGQNPILPPGKYIADPTARLWNDGRVYVYGTLIDPETMLASERYDVISSSDLRNWQIHENVFASAGKNDQVSYVDAKMWAPDCMFANNQYYLYYCMPHPVFTEGVAVSGSPEGPFTDGTKINLHGYNEIDPAVFIDDDGQAYYLWGQFTLKMAKLRSNMMEIEQSSIRDNIITESEHHFHEGAFLTKRNGIYYLVYADISRAGMPTSIGYATSRSPFGPYEYGGIIIDNDHSDPGVWNNHGSLIEINGQWYIFYHRATHNNDSMRKICIERIHFNEDGSIPEVEMTSQGAGGPIKAVEEIDAAWSCLMYGSVRITALTKDNEGLSEIKNRDRAGFKYIDFENGVKKVEMRVAPGAQPGKIIVNTGKSWHERIAEVDVPARATGTEWITVTAAVSEVKGVKEVWLTFLGEEDKLFSIDWIKFSD